METKPVLTAARIVKIVKENEIVKSVYLEPKREIPKPKPGQFFMVWVPKFEEIPLSVSGYFDGVLRFSVARVGETTKRIHNMGIGDLLGLKGPLGNGIVPQKSRYLLIGGGYGVAPLVYLMHEIKLVGGESEIVIGARTKNLLLMIDEVETLGKVHVATDDGSHGYRGTALDLAKEILAKKRFDFVAVCGPKPLLIGASKFCVEKNLRCYVFAESLMKCGLGLCGSCVLGRSGLLVCKDGPVFDAKIFLEAVES